MSKLSIAKDYDRSGIDVNYVKSRKMVYISGWYDGIVGIEGGEFTLQEFFNKLGITEKDCREAFK